MDIVDKWNQNKNNDETDDEYDKKCHDKNVMKSINMLDHN